MGHKNKKDKNKTDKNDKKTSKNKHIDKENSKKSIKKVEKSESLKRVYTELENVLEHTYPESSSRTMVEKLLSEDYDSKLVLVKTKDNKENHIDVTKLPNGIWNVAVIVDTDKYKKAPSDQVKRIDWIYENMDNIFIYIPEDEESKPNLIGSDFNAAG